MHGDNAGFAFTFGQLNVNFGADGAAQDLGKHGYLLDVTSHPAGQAFTYSGGTLTSGGEPLFVLASSGGQILVGIPGSGGSPDIPVFNLLLNQDTGAFTFNLFKAIDQGTDLVFSENTIALDFAVTVSDDDKDSLTIPNAIHIEINDDTPIARDDSDTMPAGTYGPATGNVMTGVGEDLLLGGDSQGADTAVVTGVAAGNLSADQDGHVGTVIQGSYGKLTLGADGEYTYSRDPGTKGVVDDVFTYTLTDKDGDTSTATLTIHIGNAPAFVGDSFVDVFEKGLPERNGEPAGSGEIADGIGTNDSDPSEHNTGVITITAQDGLAQVQVGSAVLSLADLQALSTTHVTVATALGNQLTLTGFNPATGQLSYIYTLLDNNSDSLVTVDNVLVTATDADGSVAFGHVFAFSTDDVPAALPDIDSVDNLTNIATGNVVTGADTVTGAIGADVPGADGATVTMLVGGFGASVDPDNSNGLTVAGFAGTLTMTPDGQYTYTRTNGDPLIGPDTFHYTLTDGDGDQSVATLVININDQGVRITDLAPKAAGGDVMVDEDNLLASRGPGESAGSDTTPESTTATGTFTISTPDGLKDLTIDTHAVISGGVFTPTSFTTALGNTFEVTGYNAGTGVITYTYTLLDNENHPAGAFENSVFEDLQVVLTDLDGDSATSTLSVNVVDDVPTANADTTSIGAGGTVIGNVETNDVLGADGAGVTGVTTGSNTFVPVFGGVGVPIVTALGTLTLGPDGSYAYAAKPNVFGIDHFVYTIIDGDGDVSTTTLDITVNDVRLATDTKIVTVNEAALDTVLDPGDLAASAITGSNPSSPDETTTGKLTLGAGVQAVTADYSGAHGTLHVDSDGSFTYTLTSNLLVAGAGTNTVPDAEIFNIQIHDKDGNTATDTIKVNVIDDVPSAFNPQDQSLLNSPAVSVITGSLDIAGHTGADGYGSIVFSGGSNGDKATRSDGVTPITYQGHNVLLQGFGTDTLIGFADIDNSGVVGGPDIPVFVVKLDGAGDTYSFALLKELDDGARVDFTDLSGISAGNTDWFGVGANGGAAGSNDLLYTPLNFGGNINTSKNDIGSGDQWIDPGEGVRMDFVNDLTGNMKAANGFDFAGHYQVQDYQVTIAQVGGGGSTALRLTAADVTKLNNVGGTTEPEFLAQTLVAITPGELVVMRGNLDVTGMLLIDYTDAGKNDGGVIISGLLTGDVIKLHDSTGFDRVEIDGVGTQFALTGSQVVQTVAGTDLDMTFQTTLKDGDGDTSTGQYIGINLQTDDGQSHTFTGGAGNDTMHGGSGSDTLSGAGGTDLIFGDAGNDTMLYDSADKYDGGTGFDRVMVTAGGNSITYDSAKFIGIEMFDLGDANNRSGTGNENSLALSATDVVLGNNGTVGGHQISFFVIGDNTGPTAADRDNVHLNGFGSVIGSGAFTDPVTGLSHSYDVYQSTANAAIKVAVEQGLDIT